MRGVQDAGVDEGARATPDPTGVERVYREDGERLWRALVGFTGDPDVASDAVAEAFAQLLRRGGAVRSPRAWVWRASFRIAAGELKARGRFVSGSEGAGLDAAASPASHQDWLAAESLVGALAELSPKQRAAVVLHHYAGYPVREVAAIIGSTGPAVRVHLSRGRKRLRELLEEDDA
jgi:RNA polymerase sigma-70 factor (ECF subfamily)